MAGKIQKIANKIATHIFELKITPLTWMASFAGIMSLRTFIKSFIAVSNYTETEVIVDYLHELFFFFIIFALIWIFLSLILKVKPQKVIGLMFWSSWMIIFPPLIDIIKTKGSIYWSFYLLGSPSELWREFITIFGQLPSGVYYFGTKIVFIAAIIIIAALVYFKTKNILKMILSAVIVYSIFFFMGAFPSIFYFADLLFGKAGSINQVHAFSIMQFYVGSTQIFGTKFDDLGYLMAYNINLVFYLFSFALATSLFFMSDWKKFLAVLKNSRPPQLIYHGGLFFIGLGLGYLAYPGNLNINIFSVAAVIVLLLSVWLAWTASVIVNDINDYEIDRISNPERPLQKGIFTVEEYRQFGIIVFALSILGGLVIGLKFAALLAIYQFVAWVYSGKSYRLKRFPVIATFLSAVASILVLFLGFILFSGDDNIQKLSYRIILMFLLVLTLSLPIKDFKDIEGDKKDEVWTIPVLFGEEKGRLIVAGGVFISFMSSVFFLNELRLFFWALLAGIGAFLIIVNQKINPRRLFWWVLGVVFIYGIILVKIVFLS